MIICLIYELTSETSIKGNWLTEEIEYIKECVKQSSDLAEAAELFVRKYKRSAESARHKARQFKNLLSKNPSLQDPEKAKEALGEQLKIKRVEQERDEYKKLYDEAIKHNMKMSDVRAILHDIGKVVINDNPTWIAKDRKASAHGIPVLHISDIHYGEQVFKSQVNGRNEYDTVIAKKRLNHTFETATNILMNSFSSPKYDGIVVPLNGDVLSGNIHEELRNTNCEPIAKSVVGLAEILIQNITALSKVFPKVFVPCQVGNHGRMDKKPRMKDGVYDNYEWIAYSMLEKHFRDSETVTIKVPESFETTYQIYNRRFLQVHGDAFSGGNGIAGIIMPIIRGQHKKLKGYAALDQPFDIMIIGHFHQYHMLPTLGINGSVKGYDEYAFKMSFGFERPIQSLWIEHPEMGLIFATPIYCDSYAGGYSAGNVKQGVRVI